MNNKYYHKPKLDIDKTVATFPGSHIIGDVKIGENSSVWYNAVIRGDRGPIVIGKNSNVQDNCVIHCNDNLITYLRDNVSVGHGAILHGCQIENNVLIGMNATVLDGAKIGKDSVVGAGALVTGGKEYPEKSLILGVPGKIIKKLNSEEIAKIKENALIYAELAKEKHVSKSS
ncbi:MAG: gamma carbonic anhydrase family protein [Methanobacteriaceae archaeon]|nr:gamma carbonic anhydrase family protein [Candidatus Methanorudis spinitermitis]